MNEEHIGQAIRYIRIAIRGTESKQHAYKRSKEIFNLTDEEFKEVMKVIETETCQHGP